MAIVRGDVGRRLLAMLFCCAWGVSILSGPAAGEEVTPADDAYHYRDWADGRHDGNYTEWWYFNVFDDSHDVQAIFSYFVTDPENLTGHGLSQMAAAVFSPQGHVKALDLYPPESFDASYDQADVQIEANAIEVIDADAYRITGASLDGRLSWDLTYVRESEPWFAAHRMRVGLLLPWERMDWLIYMPRAHVTGQLEVDGQAYVIDAPGYHDHNWGEWIFSRALWNWAQYSEPGLSVDIGDFIGLPVGLIGLNFEGQRTVFTKGQYTLIHTRWAFDPKNRTFYPVKTRIRAGNGSRILALTIEVDDTIPLRGDLPVPLADVLIYEQTARYHGRLWEKSPDGQWALSAVFEGNGFKEYTARTRRPPSP